MKIVTITRSIDTGKQTQGRLSTSLFSCVTLERPWKQNAPNISCIPLGLYFCKWTFSWRLLKYTYEVQNVKNRSGIRIHPGNYFFDIEGCILLGSHFQDINKDKELDVLNSTITLKSFENIMNRESFDLIIK